MSSGKELLCPSYSNPRAFRYRQRDIAIVLNEHCRSR